MESPHHPDAVGTYLSDFLKHVNGKFLKTKMRAWQIHALARLLEHDDYGNLVWTTAAVSTPRQVGKTVKLRAYCWWRFTRGPEIFEEEQLVVNIANRLALAMDFWGAANLWVRDDPSRGTSYLGPGRQRLDEPGGQGSWLPKSTKGAYGLSISMPVVDEAWDVRPDVMTAMLMPTMLAKRSPQLVLTSTAHSNCTSLFPDIRLSHGKPDAPFLIEWSAPHEADLEDQDAWRAASPIWNKQRRKFLAQFFESTPAEVFRRQHLNVWPDTSMRVEDRYTLAEWAKLPHHRTPPPKGVGVTVMEATPDLSAFSASLVTTEVRDDEAHFRVWHKDFTSLNEMLTWAAQFQSPRTVVGLSLRKNVIDSRMFTRTEVIGVGMKELKSAVPVLLSVVRERRLEVEEHDATLRESADSVAIKTTEGGQLTMAQGGRAPIAAVKTIAWGIFDLLMAPAVKPKIW